MENEKRTDSTPNQVVTYDFNNPNFRTASYAHREAETLKNVIGILDDLKRGYLPALPEVKKAAQLAVKELCAALCEYADKD